MANLRSLRPRTFYLNERHQLVPSEKKGGGGLPKFGDIDWESKGRRIGRSLKRVSEKLEAAKDPLRGKRYFVMAVPVDAVPKRSEAANKPPELDEVTDYRGKLHAQVFGRLGLDLIDVMSNGNAIVHARPDHLQQLIHTSEVLGSANAREQARWSTLDTFDIVPASERLDFTWVRQLKKDRTVDILFELHPLLTRIEADVVLRALVSFARRTTERIVGTGSDISGRQWARAQMSPDVLVDIANELSSVQSIHPPLQAKAAVTGGPPPASATRRGGAGAVPVAQNLPSVAIFDEGVPAAHVTLAPFSRGAQVVPRGAQPGHNGDHGSKVATRIVFGEVGDPVTTIPPAECRFLDVRVSDINGLIDAKTVLDGLNATATALPDVRVFNLSINSETPLAQLDTESQKEWHRTLRDVDNFAFERDVAIVVAAGNAPSGVIPIPGYPHHLDDPRWGLGSWSTGFNTFVCGAFAGRPSQGGLADPEWPSPFTMIGPGVCDSPVPQFAAPGGNYGNDYQMHAGMGENVLDSTGQWIEDVGTSLAAPLLAREVALATDAFAARCPPGSRPYIALSKAFLTLTAAPCDVGHHVRALAERTVGRGRARRDRLSRPLASSAVFLWQGEIGGSHQKHKILIPIPGVWLQAAKAPQVRMVVAWETPVNDANSAVWACRKVECQLRRGTGMAALKPTTRGVHRTYPLIDRVYDLRPHAQKSAKSDDWLVEVSYTEQGMAQYFLGATPDPRQRVGIAIEVMDAGEDPISPQGAIQALPTAISMDVLSPSLPLRVPLPAGRR